MKFHNIWGEKLPEEKSKWKTCEDCSEILGKPIEMKFIIAKLKEDPAPEDIFSGWFCPECAQFHPVRMTKSVEIEVDKEHIVEVSTSAVIFLPADEWVLEDKTEEAKKALK